MVKRNETIWKNSSWTLVRISQTQNMCFVCVLIHAQTAVLKTSAELYCSFSNTKLQNGDGGGPHDDYKKKQARNEGCGSSFLFLLPKNRSFFICLSNVSLGGLTSLDLPRRNMFNDRDVSPVNMRKMFFLASDTHLQSNKTICVKFSRKKSSVPRGKGNTLVLCPPAWPPWCQLQMSHSHWITKKQSLADRNLITEIEGYASLWNNALIITGEKKHKRSQNGEFCVEGISRVHFTIKHYRIIGSHVKTVTTLSLVSLTAVFNVITQRHLKQLQGRLLDPWSSFTSKSNNNFN